MRKYSVIVLRDSHDDMENVTPEEVKRFPANTLKEAKSLFDHHSGMANMSLAHKTKVLGLNPKETGRVWLFDHDCQYELEEKFFA